MDKLPEKIKPSVLNAADKLFDSKGTHTETQASELRCRDAAQQKGEGPGQRAKPSVIDQPRPGALRSGSSYQPPQAPLFPHEGAGDGTQAGVSQEY